MDQAELQQSASFPSHKLTLEVTFKNQTDQVCFDETVPLYNQPNTKAQSALKYLPETCYQQYPTTK